MKIKRDYKRILDELNDVHPLVLFQILKCIYNDVEFRRDFPKVRNLKRFDLANLIMSEYKKINVKSLLKRIIKHNNTSLCFITRDIKTIEDVKRYTIRDLRINYNERAERVYCIFLYYLSKNIFEGDIYEFLKRKSKSSIIVQVIKGRRLAKKEEKYTKIKLIDPLENSLEEKSITAYFNESKYDTEFNKFSPKEIEDYFFCEYDKKNKVFNNVKRGILYYLRNKLMILLTVLSDHENFSGMLCLELEDLEKRKEKFEVDRKIFIRSKEKNIILERKIKSLKRDNLILNEKILNRINKSSNKDLEKQNYDLHKEINYLQTRIEKMEEQVSIYEEEKRLNTELSDNITIEEKPVTKQVYKPEYMNIVVAGGRWTSDNRKKVQQYLPDNEIEFIEADKILRNYDKIANCDIIFFDTSYNSHAYYYKLKKCSGDFYHINASNLLEFEKIYEGE